MIDLVLGYVILAVLIYGIIWVVCRIFRIPLEKYEQMIIQSNIGQQLSEIEYSKYFLIALIIAFLYDNITTCDNDPLGINECEQVDPREYDSYRGRR